MKCYFKNALKSGILIFGVFTLLWNCQKDETLEHNHESIENNTSEFSRVSINDLIQTDNIFYKLSKAYIPTALSSKSTSAKNTSSDLIITSDTINVVEKENYKSYTLRIKRKGYEFDTENLIIEQNNGIESAYILSYDFDNDYVIDLISGVHSPPKGTVYYSKFNTSNLNSKTSTAKSSGSCQYLTITITAPCGCGDYIRSQCRGCSYGNRYPTSYTHTELVCDSGGGSGNEIKLGGPLTTKADGISSSGGSGGPTPTKKGSSTSSNLEDMSEFVEFKVNKLITRLELNTNQAKWVGEHIQEALDIYDFVAKDNRWSDKAEVFAKWEINFEMLPKVPCGINHDCVKSIKTMAAGLRKFHGEDGKLMADYFDSLVADFNTFTRDDLQVFYDTAFEITRQYNANMRKAIIFGFIEGVTPIIEIALLEVGGPVAIKLLKRIPISWVLRGTRLNEMVIGTTKLGEAGFLNSRLIPKSTIQKTEELFKMLTKDAINVAPSASNSNVIVAQMGAGRKIILRLTSTTVPEAIRVIEFQNFNTALGTSSYTLKFIP